MKTTDTEIVKWYLKGYEDESFGTSSIMPDTEIFVKAYEIGVNDVLPSRKYNAERDVKEIIKKINKL